MHWLWWNWSPREGVSWKSRKVWSTYYTITHLHVCVCVWIGERNDKVLVIMHQLLPILTIIMKHKRYVCTLHSPICCIHNGSRMIISEYIKIITDSKLTNIVHTDTLSSIQHLFLSWKSASMPHKSFSMFFWNYIVFGL